MYSKTSAWMIAGALYVCATSASAQTAPFFEPLTESAPVTAPNSIEEMNAPWVVPAGVAQTNLTSMNEIEADPAQSVVRAPSVPDPETGEPITPGTSQSMWDMAAYDATGRFVFVPHESPWSAGLSRYDRWTDENQLLWSGDALGAIGDWSNDWGAFDPATFTPNCTVLVGEEWTGEGRIMETLNPYAAPEDIQVRELDSIANTAHEGLRFSLDERTIYFIDEWNSGSIYKFVMHKKGDFTKGQTFVLAVDAFEGNPADYWNEESNIGQPRTGMATWVPITDRWGNPLTTVSPFRNGPTNDPRESDDTRGGRVAADEVNGTPYGRPEDMEISRLKNGSEVMYFTATSETSIYSVEMLPNHKAMVRTFASSETPTNVGFAETTGTLDSPDNLAQDALGNIYVIEDAPNGSDVGGDIWFVRDVDDDGEAESLDHFMSIRVDGSESTGMIFSPQDPTKFVVNVQHPDSIDLDLYPNGFGDALWQFDVSGTDRHFVKALRKAGKKQSKLAAKLSKRCEKAMKQQMQPKKRSCSGKSAH